MTLSRSDSRIQRWAVRAIAAFLIVYLLGSFGIPTLVPYLAAIIAVVVDAVRMMMSRRAATRVGDREERPRETIH